MATKTIGMQDYVSLKKKSAYYNVQTSTGYNGWSSNSADRIAFSTKPTNDSFNTSSSSKKIAIAMSGGVDSSVVAYLLSKSNPIHELIGIHMSNWDFADENPAVTTTMKSNKSNSVCWEQDWKDASAVATQLKIPIHHVSFQGEYWNEVFQPYCQKLSQSITPNPDVDCNKYVKFGALKDYLKKRFSGDEVYLATGHYARIWDRSRNSYDFSSTNIGCSQAPLKDMPEYLQQALEEEESTILADYILHRSVANAPLLLSARDRTKDQSYFLSGVSAAAFSGVLFPLGDYYKTKHKRGTLDISEDDNSDESADCEVTVRQIAQHARLPNCTKKDSMGICFIGKRKHANFIDEYVDNPLGDRDGRCSPSSTYSLVQCINVEDNQIVSTFDPIDNPSLLYATIGQGAKISGAGQKWFVVDKQLQPPKHDKTRFQRRWKSPCILICPGTHHPSLYADRFYIKSKNFNWIAGGEANRPLPLPFRARCRIRHLQPLVDCEIVLIDKNDSSDFEVKLSVPLRGISPGQVFVVYAGGKGGDLVCLGGGPIDQTGQSYWELERDLPNKLHPSGHNDSSVTRRNTEGLTDDVH